MEQSLKEGIIMAPVSPPHQSTIIFLHGLGDTGGSWAMALRNLRPKFPNTKFICPTAPTRPVTVNNGHKMTSWHDIASLSSLDDENKESFAGVDESIEIVTAIIEREIEAGIEAKHIVLGGFSQGAAMSLRVGMTIDKQLAGVVALSGYALQKEKLLAGIEEHNRKVPTLICHGTADGVVLPQFGASIKDELIESGVENVQFREFPGMQHSTCQKEMKIVEKFFASVLNSSTSEKEEI